VRILNCFIEHLNHVERVRSKQTGTRSLEIIERVLVISLITEGQNRCTNFLVCFDSKHPCSDAPFIRMSMRTSGIDFTILKMAGPIKLLRLSEQMGLNVLMNAWMYSLSVVSYAVATAAQAMPSGSFMNGLKWDGFATKDH